MDFLDVIFKIFLVVLGLGFIIFVHELGHFLVARWCGVRAHSFSFGMGPILFGFTPKYPWRPGAKDFKYNAVLGPDVLEDTDKLELMLVGPDVRDPKYREAALARLPNTRFGHRRLRILEWPVEKLTAGMVLAHIDRQGNDTRVSATLIDDAKLAELKASGDKTVMIYDAGETEYRLSLLPLGGYVGMAGGEVPGEGMQQNLPDEFLSVGPGKRAAILSAGVIMNAVSAVLMFIVAYGIGVDSPPGVIGSAGATTTVLTTDKDGNRVPDPNAPGPAWVAGLRDGDRVVDIKIYNEGEEPPADDGTVNPDIDFTELRIAVAFTDPGQIVRLFVERGADHVRHAIDVKPVYSPERGFMVIGVGQTLATRVEQVAGNGNGSGEQLKRGDWVLSVNGTDLDYAFAPPTDWKETLHRPWPRSYPHLKQLMRGVTGDTVKLGIARNGQAMEIEVPVTDAPRRMPELGLDHVGVLPVRAVRPGGPAAEAVRAVQGDNGELVPGTAPADAWPLKPGDRVVQVGDVTIQSFEHMRRLVNGLTAGEPALFTVERAGEGGALERVQVFMAPVLMPETGDLLVEFLPDQRESDAAAAEALEILHVDPDGPAAQAKFLGVKGETPAGVTIEEKILPKDLLRMIDDTRVVNWGLTGDSSAPGVLDQIQAAWTDQTARTANTVRLQIVRTFPADAVDGSDKPVEVTLEFQVTPTVSEGDMEKRIGFAPSQAMVTINHYGMEAVSVGFEKTWTMIQQVFLTLRSLFKGTVHAKNIGGPVMIATVSYRFAGWGLGTFIYFMAIISVNLAIINLLPIPVLDGGHLVFVGLEAIRGKPVNERVQGYAMWVGVAAILTLLVFVMYNDISRLING